MNYVTDLLVATGGGLTFLLLSWLATRAIFVGRPLPLHMKTTLRFGFFFILGMAYIMMFVSWLNWSPKVIYALVPPWGASVGYLAWRHHRRIVQRQT